MRKLIIIFSFFVFSIFAASAQNLYQPLNLDFEEGTLGGMPYGWDIPKKVTQMGYKASLVSDNPVKGAKCLELKFDGDKFEDEFYGSVLQSVDAAAYRGKRIKIRAAIRCIPGSEGAAAYIWAHEKYRGDKSGWMQINEEQPVVMNNWKYAEITGLIDNEATIINYGLLLKGKGVAWIDDVSFTVLEEMDYQPIPPSPLRGSALDNISAFIKALGYAQFYYPGLGAIDTDWNKFARDGILKAGNAENKDSLAKILNAHFKQIAPEILISSSNGMPFPYQKPADAHDNVLLTWIHSGLGVEDQTDNFYSRIINLYESQRTREAATFQTIKVNNYVGKKFTFKADIKVEQSDLSGQAQIWVRIDDDKHNSILTLDMFKNPVTSPEWKTYSQEFTIPKGADIIKIGLVFIGEGKAWFDQVQLTADDGTLFLIKNAGFEDQPPGPLTKSWITPKTAYYAGYDFNIVAGVSTQRQQSLMISSDSSTGISLPSKPETFMTNISSGISFMMPYTVYVSDKAQNEVSKAYAKGLASYFLSSKDRASRIAIVGMFWNYINNFNLYKINNNTLDSALKTALSEAALDKNKEELLKTLQKLSTVLDDGLTRVWLENYDFALGVPFLWELIDGKLYISKVLEGQNSTDVKVGDEVMEINGKPVGALLKEKNQYISGSTERWKNLRALAETRSSLENEPLKLKLLSSDGSAKEIAAKKDMKLYMLKKNAIEPLTELDSGIYYIDLTTISDKELLKMNSDIASAKALVLDLRGSSSSTEYFLGYFTKDSLKSLTYKIPIYNSPDNSVENYKKITPFISPLKPSSAAKLIFLADENTNGYAESILSLVKFYKLGTIVGRQTSGNIGEVYPLRMPDGLHASLNVMRIFSPDGSEITKSFIIPDVPVKRTLNNIINNEDELLLKAIDIINNNKL